MGQHAARSREGVEAALDEMRPAFPASRSTRRSSGRRTSSTTRSRTSLTPSWSAVLLMMLVLIVFLYDWRSALISAVAIPLSLTAAGLVLHLRGVTINTMILAGFVIALGAVVDDAIIDCENIVRRLRIHRKVSGERSVPTTAKIVFDASLEVRGAVVYASMIEVSALLPIFFLTGLTGSFFRPLAAAYALAVVVSMLVALTDAGHGDAPAAQGAAGAPGVAARRMVAAGLRPVAGTRSSAAPGRRTRRWAR